MRYLAYNLTEDCKQRLLELFPPAFVNVHYHHVTYLYGVSENTPVPLMPERIAATHFVRGEPGLTLLIVEVNGEKMRPDGATYHLTLSTDEGVEQVEANKVLLENPWQELALPVVLDVVPGWND